MGAKTKRRMAAGFVCLCLIFTGIFVGIQEGRVSGDSRTNRCYALTAQVIAVDRPNDLVYAEDFNGMIWSFYGCEDWLAGDCCSLLMDSMGTAIIYDDQIINARYGAWDLKRW